MLSYPPILTSPFLHQAKLTILPQFKHKFLKDAFADLCQVGEAPQLYAAIACYIHLSHHILLL